MSDLVALVPDKNVEYALRGLLSRPQSLDIRPVSVDVYSHPRRDPGCLNEAHGFLRPLAGAYEHALVFFDHQGCGQEQVAAGVLAERVRALLARSGWGDRAEVIVFVPELEVWVWCPSPHVDECLGWAGRQPSLRAWLAAAGHWPEASPKPPRPKEAVEAALREARKPRSSEIYQQLAQRVSLRGHAEPAFVRLTQTLQRWFPA